ncbi:MAG: glycosyltransferase, partial [Candidatus Eremiobacterota bacterium]
MSGNIFDPIKSYNDPILSVNIQAIERILSKGKLKLAVLALTGLIVEYPDISELYNILEEIKGEVSGKSDIKVSAIISVYNSEEFIRGCLEDLVSQTFYQKGLLEIIVVNSGSQENEENIIKEFQAQYSNIIYIKSPVRETIYTSWNRGAKAAKGKYLVNTNSDDRLRKDALEIMAHTLDERHDVGVVYIEQIETIYANETFENHHVNGFLKRHECRKETILLFNPCGPQVMWRKDIHDLIGYFNPYYEVAGDWEFWLRIMFNTDYKIHLIPDMLGLYYKNTKGLEHSGRKQKEQLLEI